MLKETLLVNAEGIGIALITYLLFSMFHLREKIRNEKSYKRSLAVFIYCIFWGFIFCVVVAQNRYQSADGENLSWYLIFWIVFSNWEFYLMPVYKEYREKMKR